MLTMCSRETKSIFLRQPVIEEAIENVPMSVVEFMDAIEEPLKDQYLPEALGKTIYASLLGTAANLTPADNVKVTFFVTFAIDTKLHLPTYISIESMLCKAFLKNCMFILNYTYIYFNTIMYVDIT